MGPLILTKLEMVGLLGGDNGEVTCTRKQPISSTSDTMLE